MKGENMSELKLFVTSDLHLNHDKDFVYASRGFQTIQEHDEAIIRNWNSVVSKNDMVYVLGDVIMGNDREDSLNKLKRLNGKIFILLGNHDTDKKFNDYSKCPNVFVVFDDKYDLMPMYSIMQKVGKWSFLCSHYPTIMTGNIFDSEHLSKRFCLHGHTHSKDKFEYFQYGCYNVALDAHNNTPVSIEDIKEDIRNEFSRKRNEILKNNEL